MSVNLRGNNLPQVAISPTYVAANDSYVLANGTVGAPGMAMGMMGLTYTKQEVESYALVYKTSEGKDVKVGLA